MDMTSAIQKYKQLQYHLTEVSNILNNLSAPSCKDDDLQQLVDKKLSMVVMDNVLTMLDKYLTDFKFLKLKKIKAMTTRTKEFSIQLDDLEKFFGISTTEKDTKTQECNVSVDIGNDIKIDCKLYAKKEDIPIMSYGAIIQSNGDTLIVWRYSSQDFVSCTSFIVADYSSQAIDNYRSICCANQGKCQYGHLCKYFHDPLMWPGSTHIQRFLKTPFVRQCPYFGHMNLFSEQLKTLDFEHLRTLARYIATMALLINKVSLSRIRS
jgi:hypothetical protein